MNNTIDERVMIEKWRKAIIDDLFESASIKKVWPAWQKEISRRLPELNGRAIFDLGDAFAEIFNSCASEKSLAGSLFESLTVLYCNMCLIGKPALVIPKKERFLPHCITDALAVNYFSVRLEPDLSVIGLVFQSSDEEAVFNSDLIHEIQSAEFSDKIKALRLKRTIDLFTSDHFNDVTINAVKCKTNWNDTAQIPMLWDMVYENAFVSETNGSQPIHIGQNDYRVTRERFTYAFLTLPTNTKEIKPDSVSVLRVKHLSGGTYWGLKSIKGTAQNIKEMLIRHYSSACDTGITHSLDSFIQAGGEEYIRILFRLGNDEHQKT